MRYKNLIVGIVIIASLLGFTTKVMSDPLDIVKVTDLSPKKQVEYFADLYVVDSNLISLIIDHESQWNNSAVGDGGRSRGIAQFQKSSFERMAKAMGEELDYTSEFDQIKLLVWGVANGYGREWTAYRCIKNGGKYNFYSRQLGKHFHITCKIA